MKLNKKLIETYSDKICICCLNRNCCKKDYIIKRKNVISIKCKNYIFKEKKLDL